MSSHAILREMVEHGEFISCGILEGETIYRFGIVPSTMDIASLLIDKGRTGIILASEQSRGRGRYGKKWFSSMGGLYFSWAVAEEERFAFYLTELASLSLLESIMSFGIICRIKFPNDIIWKESRKIAGILIEKKGSFYNIGIGINVNNPLHDIETGISMGIILGRTVEDPEEILSRFITLFRKNSESFAEDEDSCMKKWSNNLIK